MSFTTASIPRFLLPQRGQIWRRVVVGARPATAPGGVAAVRVRFAHNILEKPTKFNPPSHGARLPTKQPPRHYGGELSAQEVRFQAKRDYPGMMAPKGSWAHWFLHSRAIHLWITLGTLGSLATWVYAENFRRSSPYIDMVPSWGDLARHPITSIRTIFEVVKLTEAHNSALTAEKRDKKIDDVVKRRRYRREHGIEEIEGVGGWLRSTGNGPRGPEEEEAQSRAADAVPAEKEAGNGQRKKFLGIF